MSGSSRKTDGQKVDRVVIGLILYNCTNTMPGLHRRDAATHRHIRCSHNLGRFAQSSVINPLKSCYPL